MSSLLRHTVHALAVLAIAYGAYELGRQSAKPERAAAALGSSPPLAQRDEPRSVEDHVSGRRAGEPPLPAPSPSESPRQVVRVLRVDSTDEPSFGSFGNAVWYLASKDFNPEGKVFEHKEQLQLQAMIVDMKGQQRFLDLLHSRAVTSAADAAQASGRSRTLALQEPVRPSPDALATRMDVGADGVIRAVEIGPNEHPELDEVVRRKAELLERGNQAIRQWIADH
jgi:hypothetical protein